MDQQGQQPRLYRLRLMEGYVEADVTRRNRYVYPLDFSPGPGLRATQGQLDALLRSLAYAGGARRERTLAYRLAVHDAETDQLAFDWPATGWLE